MFNRQAEETPSLLATMFMCQFSRRALIFGMLTFSITPVLASDKKPKEAKPLTILVGPVLKPDPKR